MTGAELDAIRHAIKLVSDAKPTIRWADSAGVWTIDGATYADWADKKPVGVPFVAVCQRWDPKTIQVRTDDCHSEFVDG